MESAINRDTHHPDGPRWTDRLPIRTIGEMGALAQAIVDTIRDPLLVLDQNLCVVTASRSFYQKFNMGPQNVRGRPLYELGDGQWDIPELRLSLIDVAPQHAVMQAYEVERDFPNIGRRTMLLNAREVFNHRNAEKLILLAIEDITDRCAAELLTAELLRQKETLLLEMQHRVANSLQIIASILLLKMKTVQSEETRLHLGDAHQRIMSVATAQQQLQASGHCEPIEVGPYLSRLCDTLGASMIGDSRRISLKVEAGSGTAASGELVSIGLITTELVINALKHGFPIGADGCEILVRYDVDECNWRLSVSDNGIGVQRDGDARGRTGLGTTIVEALAHQLKACVEITRLSPGMIVSIVHTAYKVP
ncbi:MAG TPA: histidine kinase dimerization/phosphoacceptor domain -containing protein [Xanthobacteraceae bacterium]|nr:histidine kinase dimerization/phosphoacceptor domain -containing protein [Xanthobacteraceae bacterium]